MSHVVPHQPIRGGLRRAMLVLEDEHGYGYMVTWPTSGGNFEIRTGLKLEPRERVISASLNGAADIKMVWNIDDLFSRYSQPDPTVQRLRTAHDELTAGVREEPPT